MSSPIEAAGEVLNRDVIPNTSLWNVDGARVVFVAVVRAAVGCTHCDGDMVGNNCQLRTDQHVELTVLGVTIWADPKRCEWVCTVYGEIVKGERHPYCPPDSTSHNDCPGWQPVWSLIARTP